MQICGEIVVSHTRGVLRIQNEHFVERPTAVGDEFVAFRRIAATTPPGDKDGIVKDYEAHSTHRLVRSCIENEDTVYLCNDVSAGCRRHKLG